MIYLYLLTIVVANLAVTHIGPSALPFTAFILIPFDLVARDYLHTRWHGQKGFYFKMLGLIVTGGVISLLINYESRNIALASCLAFLSAAIIDTVVYEILFKKPVLVKVNVSNCFSALTDSVIFPLVAFGVFDASLSFRQSLSKILGGVLWVFFIPQLMKLGVRR